MTDNDNDPKEDLKPEDVTQLLDTIKDLDLPERQRRLIDAIVKVAGDIQEADDRAFSAEFAESFTKKQADLVLEYVSTTGSTSRHPAAVPPGIIRRAAPGIIRVPPTEPRPDDEP